MQFEANLGYSLSVLARLKCIALVCFCLLGSLASAQQRHWFSSAFAGQSMIVFGSSDPRMVGGYGIGYTFGDRAKLRIHKHPGNLIGELYYNYSKSNGIKAYPANSSSAFGVLAYSRYTWYPKEAPASFFDLGWGIQVASRTTHDLESKINSTPFFDFGIIVGPDHPRAFVGGRFMHISNAGTVGKNEGQNQIYFLVQIPF